MHQVPGESKTCDIVNSRSLKEGCNQRCRGRGKIETVYDMYKREESLHTNAEDDMLACTYAHSDPADVNNMQTVTSFPIRQLHNPRFEGEPTVTFSLKELKVCLVYAVCASVLGFESLLLCHARRKSSHFAIRLQLGCPCILPIPACQ